MTHLTGLLRTLASEVLVPIFVLIKIRAQLPVVCGGFPFTWTLSPFSPVRVSRVRRHFPFRSTRDAMALKRNNYSIVLNWPSQSATGLLVQTKKWTRQRKPIGADNGTNCYLMHRNPILFAWNGTQSPKTSTSDPSEFTRMPPIKLTVPNGHMKCPKTRKALRVKT